MSECGGGSTRFWPCTLVPILGREPFKGDQNAQIGIKMQKEVVVDAVEVGQSIRGARKRLRVTQEELAELIGVRTS